MMRYIGTICVLTFLATTEKLFASDGIVWHESNGGNGHFYEFIPSEMDWNSANTAAIARGGYLATLTSEAETEFIHGVFLAHCWIGGYQEAGSIEPNGGWKWVTGEDFAYSSWGSGQPDNQNGVEHYLQLELIPFEWIDSASDAVSTGFLVEYDQPPPSYRAILAHQHSQSGIRQAIENLTITPEGQCQFVFSTDEIGSLCIISWSKNLSSWFPLLHFNTTAQGTEILDYKKESSKYYRATYLPQGVAAAESFCYPVGSDVVDEQINPERNDLFPSGAEGVIERPESGQIVNTSEWRNAQDVGSYLPTSRGPGYHAGEDWNLGGGPDDVGEAVRAVANGVVMDISPLNVTSNGGWAIVIRHYLFTGETIDSVYLHVAPPTLQDRSTQNSEGLMGSESWFSIAEGMPVAKSDVIAVVAAIDGEAAHLHLEMRDEPIANLPLGGTTAAISAYWPHSLGNAYYSSFSALRKDGIIDPSDFIDDHP